MGVLMEFLRISRLDLGCAVIGSNVGTDVFAKLEDQN